MQTFKFLRQFATKPSAVGAVAPSSRALGELMAQKAGLAEASSVVEFGPGTGALTRVILDHLVPDAEYLGLEINPKFVSYLRKKYPTLQIVEDSAVNAARHLSAAGRPTCDAIISGLPYAIFDDALQNSILDEAHRILEPGGRFVTFSYAHAPYMRKGKRFREKLLSRFSVVEKSAMVWNNIPPAFAYCAVK